MQISPRRRIRKSPCKRAVPEVNEECKSPKKVSSVVPYTTRGLFVRQLFWTLGIYVSRIFDMIVGLASFRVLYTANTKSLVKAILLIVVLDLGWHMYSVWGTQRDLAFMTAYLSEIESSVFDLAGQIKDMRAEILRFDRKLETYTQDSSESNMLIHVMEAMKANSRRKGVP